jgi:hypothetical protein
MTKRADSFEFARFFGFSVRGRKAASAESWTKDQEQRKGGSNNTNDDVDHGWAGEAGSLFGGANLRIHS